MVHVRTATIEDAPAVSTVRIETWRAAYAGLMDQRLLDRLDVERDAARRTETWEARHADARVIDLVAVDGDEVIGWGCAGPSIEPSMPEHGQLFALYVLHDRWSTGAGHLLMVALEDAMRAGGFRQAFLHVLEGNERAARFYERHGWREDGVTIVDERFAGGMDVPALIERQRIRDLDEAVAG